jgi:hypothetical protein
MPPMKASWWAGKKDFGAVGLGQGQGHVHRLVDAKSVVAEDGSTACNEIVQTGEHNTSRAVDEHPNVAKGETCKLELSAKVVFRFPRSGLAAWG